MYGHLKNTCEMTDFVTVDDVSQCVAKLFKGKVGKMVFPLSILYMPQSTILFCLCLLFNSCNSSQDVSWLEYHSDITYLSHTSDIIDATSQCSHSDLIM